uniref:Uncharacterized protein n=1 Tax=viral metagenome TaxID=1070528 RepID=A0A6M3K647_9ZZZZ
MALYSNTLAVVRQHLSSAVGDLITGTFDSGDTNNAVDTMLRKGDDYYNEHHYRCYIYEGTNIGEEREVSDWVNSTNSLTLEPGFTDSVDTTTDYELHYIFTEDEYRKAINMAISSIADDYLLDAVDTNKTFSTGIYEYAMPTSPEFEFVHRVTRETTAAGDVFRDEDIIDPSFYKFILVGSASYIKFDEEKYKITSTENGKDMRIEGQQRQSALTSDTSICYLPLDWIIYKAITFLPNSKIMSSKLDKTLEIALSFVANMPVKRPYPKSKRVVL